MIKNNIISIVILIYFLINTFYITNAPDSTCNGGSVLFDIIFFCNIYGLIIFWGIFGFKVCGGILDKCFSLALAIHSLCFFSFYTFNIGRTMSNYLTNYNSHEIILLFTGIVFLLIILIVIVIYKIFLCKTLN